MGHAAAITDEIKSLIAALQILINIRLHVVDFDFHTLTQGILVGCTGSDLVQRIDHLDNTVQNTFWQYQTQITGSGFQGRNHHTFLYPVLCTSAVSEQIAETLHDDTTAQHIRQMGNTLSVAVAVIKGLF